MKLKGEYVLVCMDASARSKLLGGDVLNGRGMLLENVIEEGRWKV